MTRAATAARVVRRSSREIIGELSGTDAKRHEVGSERRGVLARLPIQTHDLENRGGGWVGCCFPVVRHGLADQGAAP